MAISIYNSLTRKKEEFIPLSPPKVNLYTCGVTVYDHCHIGHARSLYIFEVIRRYLLWRGFSVKFVRNITDIDDKIINRANELKEDWRGLVSRYIGSYYEDLAALGIEKADSEPRATENIPEMVAYIAGLIGKGFAYATSTGVYFCVRRFKDYGKLSGQSIDEMLSGARKEPDETKEDPLDFALWKMSKEGEPSWDSPWGKGRPGWHIECSVMSQKFLGVKTLDIHAGGRDLVFPHHDNEIAQAEALAGEPFAKYWIHHGLLSINGQKMSKSLGNFLTIKDALKEYPVNVLKFFFLQVRYSSPLDFTPGKMQECKAAMERFYAFFDKMERSLKKAPKPDLSLQGKFKEKIEGLKQAFISHMDDDFNTPEALGKLFDIMHLANEGSDNKSLDSSGIKLSVDSIKELACIFGMSFKRDKEISVYIQSMIDERNKERAAHNFQRADEIRKELEDIGVLLEDTKEGVTWRKKS